MRFKKVKWDIFVIEVGRDEFWSLDFVGVLSGRFFPYVYIWLMTPYKLH